jgi:hypothetical protein
MYLKHQCPVLERIEHVKTIPGQRAWGTYRDWMKAKKHPVQNPEQFLKSKYYGAFVKFIRFADKVGIKKTNIYIRAMIKKQIMPSFWTMDDAYKWYIEYHDRTLSPYDQFKTSVKTLLDMSEEFDCTVHDLFNVMPPAKLFELMRRRKLSMWLLLFSARFKAFGNELNESDRKTLNRLANKAFWITQLAKPKHKADIAKIKRIAKEMAI